MSGRLSQNQKSALTLYAPHLQPNLISNPFISGNVAVYQDALDVWRHHLYTHLSPRCVNY